MPVAERSQVAVRGSLVNRSGTIAAGGTSQQIMAANTDRAYLLIQNLSAEVLWLQFGGAAVASQPSIQLAAGAGFVMENGFISTQSVNLLGATTGSAFAAREG